MVSAVVLPNMLTKGSPVPFSDFDLQVYQLNTAGQFVPIVRSALVSSHEISPSTYQGYIDFAIFRAHQGDRFRVEVFAKSSSALEAENSYRLLVTGTGFLEGAKGKEVPTDTYNHRNIYGPHQSTYGSSTTKRNTPSSTRIV
jgi:hypothetical protein